MYYKRILDAIPELIYVTKEDGMTVEFYNQTWYDYTGLTTEDVSDGWEEIVAPEDLNRVSQTIANAVAKREAYEVEVRLRSAKTGTYKWFLSKARPIFDIDGSLLNYVGISTDIDSIKLSMYDMEKIYENEMDKRLRKIKQLEEELNIHKTQGT